MSDQQGWIYVRKSRALGDPEDQPNLLAHQREALLRLAAQSGCPVPPERVIEEVGSGEHLSTRPRFAALLAQWETEAPPAGTRLMVVGIERISRADPELSGMIVGHLIRAGVTVQTLSQRFDLREPDDLMLFCVLLAVGHHGLNRYRRDVQLRRQQQLRAGQVRTGRVPFGYVWDKNAPEGEADPKNKRGQVRPHPERFPLLVRFCREALTKSVDQIARENGIPKERLWYALRHPLICGYPARRHDDKRFGGHPGPRETWDWPEKPGDYPAACTRAEWEKIQQAIDHRRKRATKPAADRGWCRDVLRFAGAPGPVRLGSQGRRHGSLLTYERERPGQPLFYVSRRLVHDWAAERVREALSHPQRVAESLAQQPDPEAADPAAAARMEAELRGLRADLLRLLANADGEQDPEMAQGWAELARRKSGEIQERSKEMQRLQSVTVPALELEPLVELLGQIGDDWEMFWEGLTDGDRRFLVNATFTYIEVTVTPGKTCWQWRREITDWAYQPWI